MSGTVNSVPGTATTGFLGMSSPIAATDHHIGMKAPYLVVVAAFFAVLTLHALAKSQRVADFIDALTKEWVPLQTRLGAPLDSWRKR
jgi:hypothetical protein